MTDYCILPKRLGIKFLCVPCPRGLDFSTSFFSRLFYGVLLFIFYLPLYPSIETIDPIDMIRLHLVLALYVCVALSNAMSYVALDMRTPEKCFYVDYPGHDTQFTVLYQILGTLSH
jgi:predicted ABC-type exoprotein transport system permease subunit